MITENEAGQHLKFLIETDVEAGRAKALVDSLDEQRKTIEAVEFMKAKGSAAERKQIALSSNGYLEHISKLENARYEFETLRNRRLTAVTAIDMWRSVNSNQRKGNI